MKKLRLLIAFIVFAFSADAQSDWIIEDLTPLDYQIPGNKQFNVIVKNVGTTGISSYQIFWQFDNGPVKSVTKAAFDTKWSGTVGLVTDPGFNITLSTSANHQLKVWIKSILPVDTNPSNDTLVKNIKVFSTLPKKNVVLEVYKHQTCGPCYKAANYTDTTASVNPLYAVANIYTLPGELLYLADGQTINNFYGFAHPMPVFDRFKFPSQSEIGTSYTSGPNGYYLRKYGSRELYFEPVEVTFDKVKFNKATRELTVTLGAKFYDDLSGDYRFNIYLTEDSIKGYQASAPDPNNYYHKRVVRAMLGGPWGKQGSLPASIKSGDKKQYTFTYQIPQDYKTEKMRIIGFVQTYNSDGEKRTILNSTHNTFDKAVALSTSNIIVDNNSFIVYPNPAKDHLLISADKDSEYNVTLTDITGKIYSTSSGIGNTKIDVRSLAPGSYYVYIDDGKAVHTHAIVKE